MLILSRNYQSLRILVYLCGRPGFEASTRDIAEALSLPINACRNRVLRLREAGYLAGERGYAGGVKLAAHPGDTLIGDVVAAIEAQRRQTGDVEPECKALFERAASRFLLELNRMTVLDVCPCEAAVPCNSFGANQREAIEPATEQSIAHASSR